MENQENKILEKVRKLLNVTLENGSTEGEVENAIKAAEALIRRHNIDRGDVEMSPLDIGIEEIENSFKGTELAYWLWDLLAVIAKGYSTRVILHGTGKTAYYKVIGLPEDRKTVKQVFNTLLPIIRNLTTQRYNEYKKTVNGKPKSKLVFTTSYNKGFLIGLQEKLEIERNTGLSIEDKSTYGLIVVKKDALVADWIKEEFKNLKNASSKKVELDGGIYHKGKADGSETSANSKLH